MRHATLACFLVASMMANACGSSDGQPTPNDEEPTTTMVGPHTSDGYYAIVGDGNFMYSQLGNTGGNGTGSEQSYIVSAESDGMTWKPYNTQTFRDGPYRMAFDSVNRIIYSANWNAGVWALKVMAP